LFQRRDVSVTPLKSSKVHTKLFHFTPSNSLLRRVYPPLINSFSRRHRCRWG